MTEIDDGNLVYIDEFRREAWVARINAARASGEVAVFNTVNDTDAVIIPFPDVAQGDFGS